MREARGEGIVDRRLRDALAFLSPVALAAAWLCAAAVAEVSGAARLGALGAAVALAIAAHLAVERDREGLWLCGGVYTAALGICAVSLWLEAGLAVVELGFPRFARALPRLDRDGMLLAVGPAAALLPVSWLWLEWLGKAAGWTSRDGKKRAESELYGKATLLARRHLRALEDRPGILLGQSAERATSPLIGWGLEGSAITFAPPRTGKGATIALNYLAPGGRGWPGSTVLLDPRGETWCVVARRRRQMGREVVLLDPFGVVKGHKERVKGLHLPQSESRRYNPMDFVRRTDEAVGRDVNALLDALLTPPAGSHDASMHFYHSARAVIAGYVAWVKFMAPEERQTLREVSRLLSLSGEERAELAAQVRDCPRVAGGLPLMAVERLSQVGVDEGGSLFSTIANQLAFLQYPELAENTAASDFDPTDLAGGRMDLFVVVPEDMMEPARPWLRLWVTIPNAVSAVRRLERDMLIVVDEMPALGLLKPMMDAYTMSAGRGVHFWGFAQSISALDRSWGSDNRQVLVDLSELVQVLGFPRTDVDGAEKLSLAMGSATFESRAESRSGQSASAHLLAGPGPVQVGDNVSAVKERLVTPDEILTMGPNRQFVVASPKDMPRDAFGLHHARYWTRADTKDLADPNPLVVRKESARSAERFGMFADAEGVGE